MWLNSRKHKQKSFQNKLLDKKLLNNLMRSLKGNKNRYKSYKNRKMK